MPSRRCATHDSPGAPAAARPLRLDDLAAAPRDVADRGLSWIEAHCEPGTGLFRDAGDAAGRLRESVWLAQGLLLRDRGDDRGRAAALLSRAVDGQLHAPGQHWHGTFSRFRDEPAPPREGAIEWVHYDPNWRQFLGAAFSLVLREHRTLLPSELGHRLERAIDIARTSEPPDRVSARYTNIALLKAWLDVEAGDPAGLDLARKIVEAFDVHGSFEEYGSPTYYGVDLYALALWRAHSREPRLRDWGVRLSDALWHDIARFYHAGLRNLAGPYTRSYGMDLRSYASLLGLWIWAEVGRDAAPFPDTGTAFEHAADLALAPSIGILASRLEPAVPDEARSHLLLFQGPRRVERTISDRPRRTATAWLDEDVAIGAESSDLDWHGLEQHHPATLHWRIPARGESPDEVGWLRVRHDGPVDARAEPGALLLDLMPPLGRSGRGTRIEIHAPGLEAEDLGPRLWRLPGLVLGVESDGTPPAIEARGTTAWVHLREPVARHIRLGVEGLG